MWSSQFLLALCATCYFGQSQFGSASYAHRSDYKNSKAVFPFISGSCSEENCSGYEPLEPTDERLHNPENGVTIENPEGEDYEPQTPEPGHPTYDKGSYVQLCTVLLKSVKELKLMHPEIGNVTTTVLKNLIHYMLIINVTNSEDCDPAIHLLDLIITAAETLRLDYIELTGNKCTYTKVPNTDASSQTPVYSSEYKTEATRKPEVTTPKSQTKKPSKVPHPKGTEPTKATKMEPTEKPYMEERSGDYKQTAAPCSDKSTRGYEPTEKPCTDKPSTDYEQTEEYYPPFVGSVRGMPGEHYPNYTEIPITSFSCADKKYVPGFYADLETGCQVFHVCYEHRRESFLCPLGTIFNQPILACDYWYSSNCSLAPFYYDVNTKTEEVMKADKIDSAVDELVSSIIDSKRKVPGEAIDAKFPKHALDDIAKFLPVKAKITESHLVDEKKIVAKKSEENVEGVASDIFNNILTTATRVVSKTRDAIASIPKPNEEGMKKPLHLIKPKLIKSKAVPIMKMKAIPVVKAKMAKVAVPIVAKAAAAKVAVPIVAKAAAAKAAVPIVATKIAVPVVAKAKLASKASIVAKAKLASVPITAKLAVSVQSAKVLATKSAAIPAKVLATKAAVPIITKGKAAAALPIAKAAALKASVPIVAKSKFVAASVPKAVVKASVPVFKTKILAASLPFAKSAALKSIPVAQAKIVAPALKAKVLKTIPVAKVKLAKTAAISPLTKKALALGYMKLLKAKKLALMG